MSDTDLTLAPIDLSIIPELGLAEQNALTKETDAHVNEVVRHAVRGVVSGFLSLIGLAISLTAGTSSLVGVLGLMALFVASATGAVFSALSLGIASRESQQLIPLFEQQITSDARHPLAPIEMHLRKAIGAWNAAAAALEAENAAWEDTVASWEHGNAVTSLTDLQLHRVAIESRAQMLLEDKRKLLDIIERLRPYDKLLTPIE